MKARDLQYLFALIVPTLAIFSFYLEGVFSFLLPVSAFIILPVFEQLIPKKQSNVDQYVEKKKANQRFFDFLLYFQVVCQYALLTYYLIGITYQKWSLEEVIGKTISMGICCGVLGINVAHELGHREKKYEKSLAKSLLLTSLYMHFFIEHNRGHHKNVSTHLDPASSRLNESIYFFWFRSIIFSFFSAWNLEKTRLQRINISPWSIKNELLQFLLIQAGFITLIGLVFNLQAVFFFVLVAVLGIFLLETVNYIEHYGLRRKEISPGVFEKVKPVHSWNSDHYLGRIILFELTRHTDHHYKSTRKYQILRSFPESPQLPLGYPASMVLSLVPPLWFMVMNKRAAKFNLPTES